MVTLLRLAACSVPACSVQHGRSASSHRSALRLRGVPWLRTALCSVCSPLQPFGPPMFASSLAVLPCFTGLTTACFAPLARGLRAPPPVSAKILRISGRGNCKETIFALENGIFRRGVLRVHAPLNSAWSSHTFAPPCANACAVFRPCGLRFAPCPRGSSRFAASDARRLACGTPCFIGLTSRLFRSTIRNSRLATLPLASLLCSLDFRFACSAHCARRSSVPQGVRFVRPRRTRRRGRLYREKASAFSRFPLDSLIV